MIKKQELIERATAILGNIVMKDVFGVGSKEPCLEGKNLQDLVEWYDDLRFFALNLNNQAVGDELLSIQYYNGERVSKNRIEYAIKLLQQVNI